MTARASPNGHRAERPHQVIDWAAQYQPDPRTPLRACTRCGGKYLDDEPSRLAHIQVFGHSPRPAEPANPPKENPP